MAAPGEMFGITVKVLLGTVPPIVVDINPALASEPWAERGEGPLVEWTVSKHRSLSPDTGTLAIYNLDIASRTALRSFVGFPAPLEVVLFVGWNGIPELLARGQATRVVPGDYTETDIVTAIEFGDGVLGIRDAPPAGGAEFGQAISTLIPFVLNLMGLRISIAALGIINERGAKFPVPSFQCSLDGEPRDLLAELLASLQLDGRIEGNELVVYEGGLRRDLPDVILLGPASGLVNQHYVDDGAYEFEALAQPRCVPGSRIQFANAFLAPVGPVLRVDHVSFSGSSEGASTMSGTARPILPLATPAPPIDEVLA